MRSNKTRFWQNILGTFLGDANLDGRINAMDLNQVGLNWLEANVTGWEHGDFNGDGLVNAMDLNILGINWLSGEAVAAAGNTAQRCIPRAPLAAVAAIIPPTVTDAAFADQNGQQLASSFPTREHLTPDRSKIDRYPHQDDIAETIANRVARRFRLGGTSSDFGTDGQSDADLVADPESEIVDQLLASLVPLR